eukprot:s5254_g2.t1
MRSFREPAVFHQLESKSLGGPLSLDRIVRYAAELRSDTDDSFRPGKDFEVVEEVLVGDRKFLQLPDGRFVCERSRKAINKVGAKSVVGLAKVVEEVLVGDRTFLRQPHGRFVCKRSRKEINKVVAKRLVGGTPTIGACLRLPDGRFVYECARKEINEDEFECSLDPESEESALADAIVSCVKNILPSSSDEDVAQILETNLKFRAPTSIPFPLQSTLEEVVTKEDFSHMT